MKSLRFYILLGLAAALLACQPEKDADSSVSSTTESRMEAINNEDEVVANDANTNVTDEVSVQGAADADSIDATSIVADMGFSTVEDSDLAASIEQAAGAAPARYCLNIETDDEFISVDKACDLISGRLASVSKQACDAALLVKSQCASVDGFPILYREFPPLARRTPQGRILVIGGIHGDELTSVSIVFKWIEKLNRFHSGLFHWHVVPMMNPDGVLPRSAQRTNKNGVDLNRNLPSDDWHENALKYWREKQGENPRRYPGEQPASEPETQWLIDEINEFKPDAIISVHAPYGVVDFDSLLLNTAPKSLGKLHLNLLGTYPGSLGNYAGINRNIPVITLELPHAWEMPSDAEITQIWEDIVSWLRKNITQDVADTGD